MTSESEKLAVHRTVTQMKLHCAAHAAQFLCTVSFPMIFLLAIIHSLFLQLGSEVNLCYSCEHLTFVVSQLTGRSV
jgi:hypothetical protein